MPKKGKRSQAAKKRYAPTTQTDACSSKSENSCKIKNSLSNKAIASPSIPTAEITTHSLVSASYHQGSIRYSNRSRGNQCTCNALEFLAHYNENENLQSIDLNNILNEGDALYNAIVTDLVHHDAFVESVLSFNELPEYVHTAAAVYNITKSQSICGLLKKPTEFPDLSNALQSLSFSIRNVLLIAGQYCISVFRSDDGTYGFFDSHARNSDGLVDANGCAIMMKIPSLDQLIIHLYRLFDSLSLKENTQYEMMPIHFHRIADSHCVSTEGAATSSLLESEPQNENYCLERKTSKHGKMYREKLKQRARLVKKRESKISPKKSMADILRIHRENYINYQVKVAKLAKFRQQYTNNIQINSRRKQYIVNRYKSDPLFRMKQKQNIAEKYQNDLFRMKQNKNIKDKYHNDPEFRRRKKQNIAERYQNDLRFRTKKKQHIADRYQNDLQFRTEKKQNVAERYQNDLQFRIEQKTNFSHKYQNDPQFRMKRRMYMKEYIRSKYASDSTFRVKHKIVCAMQIRAKYRQDHIFRLKKRFQSRCTKQSSKRQKSNIDIAVELFQKKIQAGPTYSCTVCHRAMFEKQVKQCNRNKYKLNLHIINECLTGTYVHTCSDGCSNPCTLLILRQDKEYICHSCDQTLVKGKMPPIAVANKLCVTAIPSELQGLNILERHMIAKFIPFAKIVNLPKGGQKGVNGPVVCVPSEVESTVNKLPRSTNDTQMLKVKLKRKLQYKGHYQFQTISPIKIRSAVQKLIETHSEYANVSINNSMPSNSINTVNNTGTDEPQIMEVDCDDMQIENNHRLEEPCLSNDDKEDDTEHLEDGNENGIYFGTCLQPADIGEEILAYEDKVYCIAPSQGNSPTSLYKVPKIEAMAFPVQFPDGNHTFDEPERDVRLSPSRYFNARLFSTDNRFAQDINYLFFAQFTTEMHLAHSSISIQLRKGKPTRRNGSKINSSMLKDKAAVKQMVNKDEGTRFMQPLRGTPAYWEKTMRDLFAMLRQLGTPTFFCTFSAAEMRWPEIITVIKAQQGESVNFDALDWMEKCQILKSNPVTTMRMFDQRVNTFLKELILSPVNPIGEVLDYFYRVEYQQRGSPHIHCLFWIKDAPEFDKDSDEVICEFVDKYISCELPNREDNVELNTIVTEVQTHSKNHSKSCKKRNTACRFGFPKPPVKTTFITRPKVIDIDSGDNNGNNKETAEKVAKEKLQEIWTLLSDKDATFESTDQLLQQVNLTYEEYIEMMKNISTSPKIVMKRQPGDIWVNGYNKHLLRAWNANMDIQYILNPYCCIMYIVSYISKAEREMSEILKNVLKEAQQGGGSDREDMKKVMYAYAKNREVSAQESVARTCSLNLKSASRDVVFIPTETNNVRMSLPLSVLQYRANDSEDVWMTSLPDRYKARPSTSEFENMCMAEFASMYRVVYGQTAKTSKSAICLKNDLGYIQKRTRSKPAVIRYARFSQQTDPEKYYGTLLKLYLPHRSETQLTTKQFETHRAFYDEASVKLTGAETIEHVSAIIERNRAIFERHSDRIDDALTQYERTGPIEDAWSMLAPATEVERIESIMERELPDPAHFLEQDEIPDIMPQPQSSIPLIETTNVSATEMRKMYQSLNEKQASEFYFIRDWCKQNISANKPEPFFHFVTGGAGTGKSHLIKCIYAEATKILQKMPEFQEESDIAKPTVLLTAFTGTAAFNIQGRTLHSILKIPCMLTMPYRGLGNELDKLRSQLQHVQILVIDEVSMISKKLFAYVNWRLQQIKGSKKPFGNVSVLAVGDFYQLPPCMSKEKPLCVYEEMVVDFWKENFQLLELTDIMRQKDDTEFANLLNRLRCKEKHQKLSEHDRNMLLSVTTDSSSCPTDVLHINAKNVDVNLHNANTLQSKFNTIVIIEAVDYKKDPRTGRMTKQDFPFKGTRNDLSDILQLAIGARMMLTRNVDVSDGLVNGSFGVIAAIAYKPVNTSNVHMICIQFDYKEAGAKYRNKVAGITDNVVCIERLEESISKKHAIRRQFPIKLAYACTIHKVQGMTTNGAVVSLKHIFEAGMAYVALSRTTSLHGLHIIDFDEKSIYCNSAITAALEAMPVLDTKKIRPLLTQRLESSDLNTLTIAHHNTQGLEYHIDDLKGQHELMSTDILCLTETFLSGQTVNPVIEIPGYTLYNKNRHACYATETGLSTQRGGGVAIYVKDSTQAKVIRYVYNVTDLEFLVVKTQQPYEAVIVTVYRPQQYPVSECLRNLKHLLEGINILAVDTVIMCGDFNEDQLSFVNKPILNFFEQEGFVQLIDTPTTENSTLLDVMYIRHGSAQKLKGTGVIQTYYSYHDAVFCRLQAE